MKLWGILRNRLFELARHDLRFEQHGYLWYDKANINADFKIITLRWAILRVWYEYKFRLCLNFGGL